MKLVQTLLARDEADVVGAQLEYHLGAGVDFVIATDHDSVDGTTEILESYRQQGVLRRIPVEGEVLEGPWRTRMARLAATEHDADWVINTDADEFWMPRSGTLKEIFAAIPARFGVVWALSRQFVPAPGDSASFVERMTVRANPPVAMNDPLSPYRPHAKVAHRADPEIGIRHGAHLATTAMTPLRDWYPADALHFPFRSVEQYVRKCLRRARGDSQLGQYVRAYLAAEQGRAEELYRSLVVDEQRLARGLRDGSLVVDERLRDALRARREGRAHEIVRTDADVDVVSQAAALQEADLVRIARSADRVAARVALLERPSPRMLEAAG
jgi:Glycosyl transferase family 2